MGIDPLAVVWEWSLLVNKEEQDDHNKTCCELSSLVQLASLMAKSVFIWRVLILMESCHYYKREYQRPLNSTITHPWHKITSTFKSFQLSQDSAALPRLYLINYFYTKTKATSQFLFLQYEILLQRAFVIEVHPWIYLVLKSIRYSKFSWIWFINEFGPTLL